MSGTILTNSFWLSVHGIYSDYMSEGMTADERAQSIIGAFRRLAPIARRELLADLAPLSRQLPDIYAMALAANRELEREPEQKRTAV
jgi:hypothetical protein